MDGCIVFLTDRKIPILRAHAVYKDVTLMAWPFQKDLRCNAKVLMFLILSYQENYPRVPIQPHTLAKESLTGYNSLL